MYVLVLCSILIVAVRVVVCMITCMYSCNHVVCTSASPMAIKYGNGATMQCSASPPTYSWWRSKTCDDITSFQIYSGCSPTERTCTVPEGSYGAGYYYYCCAPPDIESLTMSAIRKCFRISSELKLASLFHFIDSPTRRCHFSSRS